MSPTKYLKGECSECGGHLEFPAEAAGTTIDCPHCGKPTELLLLAPSEQPSGTRKTVVWTILTILLLVLGLGAALFALNRAQNWVARQKPVPPMSPAAANAAGQKGAIPEEDQLTKAGFQVSAIKLEKTTGSTLVYAVGTVRNSTNQQRFGVKIELDLLDSSGQKVGSATDYQPVMEATAEWQFKALVVDSKAATAKLASIKEDQ